MPISNKKSDKLSLFNETEFVKRIKWKLVFVSLPERKEKKKKNTGGFNSSKTTFQDDRLSKFKKKYLFNIARNVKFVR